MYTPCLAALFLALALFFSLSFAVSTDGSMDLPNLQAIITAAANTIWTPLNATGGSNTTYLGGLPPTIQGTIVSLPGVLVQKKEADYLRRAQQT